MNMFEYIYLYFTSIGDSEYYSRHACMSLHLSHILLCCA